MVRQPKLIGLLGVIIFILAPWIHVNAASLEPEPLVELEWVIPQIKEPQPPLLVQIYADGRSVTHIPPYRPNAGIHQSFLSSQALQQVRTSVNELTQAVIFATPEQQVLSEQQSQSGMANQTVRHAKSEDSNYILRFQYDAKSQAYRQQIKLPYASANSQTMSQSVRQAKALSELILMVQKGANND